MQDGEFQIRRLADGAIDYAFYKAEASKLRAAAKRDWLPGLRRWIGSPEYAKAMALRKDRAIMDFVAVEGREA